jgi:hypothetical protein
MKDMAAIRDGLNVEGCVEFDDADPAMAPRVIHVDYRSCCLALCDAVEELQDRLREMAAAVDKIYEKTRGGAL